MLLLGMSLILQSIMNVLMLFSDGQNFAHLQRLLFNLNQLLFFRRFFLHCANVRQLYKNISQLNEERTHNTFVKGHTHFSGKYALYNII
jgi:hypothetical protein